MNREIKFRVWDKSKKQMSLVAKINYADDGYAKTIIVEPAPKGQYHYGLVDGENGVLMQYTGLKDKNEKEIYEGDIVRYWANENPEDLEWNILSVIFVSGAFVLFNKGYEHIDEYIMGADRTKVDVEIIGNIFENPELNK